MYCGVEAVLRGGGSSILGFYGEQVCLCSLACLVWSDNKEHLQYNGPVGTRSV